MFSIKKFQEHGTLLGATPGIEVVERSLCSPERGVWWGGQVNLVEI